jgi:hypothetical protein
MKKRRLTFAAAGMCIGFAFPFIRSWMRESSNGAYFMTFLWGVPLLISIVLLVFRIRDKE